ncbi:uncharacterized protein LOC135943573 [Cloeon dipterum]|uniref:uncharacterized protein LOC135943573 n=1 Tax=Cloeon dipterum TaxID=197152 RepID=UPI00321F7E30
MDQQRFGSEGASPLQKWHLQDLRRSSGRYRTSVTSPTGDGVCFRDAQRNSSPVSKETPPWSILSGFFIIQFFVSGVLVSHGVYLNHLLFQENYWNPFSVVWPPTIFLFTWCMTRPIFRFLGMRRQGSYCKILAACGTLVLAIGLAASCLVRSTELRIVTFGLIGGLGCSMAMTQSEAQATLHFRPSVSLCLAGVSQSLSHFAAPLIMMVLVSKYGSFGALLVQASITLNGVVGALLLCKKKNGTIQISTPAPEVADDEELVVYSRVPSSPRPNRNNDSFRSWKNPASDPLDNAEAGELVTDDFSFDGFGGEESGADVSDDGRPRNHMGVEILPQILEEDEDEEERGENVIFDLSKRRMSSIRTNRDSWLPMPPLEHYSSNQQDSTVEGDSPLPLLTPSSLTGERAAAFTFNQQRTKCCNCGDALRKFSTKMLHCLKDICKSRLLPTVLINLAQKLTHLGFLAALPTVANQMVTYRRQEGAFSMALAGFGWACMVVCTPCFLMSYAKRQKGVIFSAIYLLSSVGFALLSDSRSHDRLTLGSVLVGMTHGALINMTPSILCSLWGSASIKNSVQNAVDVLTALLIIPFVALTNLYVDGVEDFKNVFLGLSYLQITMGAGALLWTILRKVFHQYQSWEVQRQSLIM